jgi:cell division septum initiation protein DivIVA
VITQEQVDELWGRLDAFHQENESLKALVAVLESKLEQREDEVAQLRANQGAILAEVAVMGTELNRARQAAADAVREYIEAAS